MIAKSSGSRSDFYEVLRQREPTAHDDAALRFDKVVSVDKASPDVAVIKLQPLGLERCLWPNGMALRYSLYVKSLLVW